jgi:hypothetical protein
MSFIKKVILAGKTNRNPNNLTIIFMMKSSFGWNLANAETASVTKFNFFRTFLTGIK